MILIAILMMLTNLQESVFGSEVDSVMRLIKESGYPAEKHKIQTNDGYILTIHRIPNPNKPSVFLMPGLLCTSGSFVSIGPEKSLGFFLYNNGFDVWLGNARGTTHGRSHISLDPNKDAEFWNFSFHEIGVLDFPSSIDYILNITGETSLQFIGHSQGSAAFFVMAAEKPEYNKKIKSSHVLAPAIYMTNMKSALMRTLLRMNRSLQRQARKLGIYELYSQKAELSKYFKYACNNIHDFLSRTICSNAVFMIGGKNEKEFNYDYAHNIQQSFPGGCSMKQIDHFSQEIFSKRFCKYDYGKKENLKKYGTEIAPDYSWKNITSKIYVYYGSNDELTVAQDIKATARNLDNLAELYKVPDPEFSHFDFLWAKHVDQLLYFKLIGDIKDNL